ncbi:hypothetical protein AGMMS49975_27200 [Clostridia bacterium]|nr:hypothetical protein AGMMS49975_27200 [Clostridia bacterium]
MAVSENVLSERKIISITGKRQITIPLKFYEYLNFSKEAECFLTEGTIVIRPLAENNDNFNIEILKDLVAQGYNGNELISEFEKLQKGIKGAIKSLTNEADRIAAGEITSSSTEDVFGED